MSLLIPTHALPLLSYRVPERLEPDMRPGTVVVAPLSGRSRLGVVVGEEPRPDRAREEILSVARDLSLPPDLVEVCRWVAAAAAVPLPTVLRAALAPGLDTGRFRVESPPDGWPWRAGATVSRQTLKRTLGAEVLRKAEAEGRVVLSPAAPKRKSVEWSVVRGDPDLRRARKQRELFASLNDNGGAMPTAGLLAGTGIGRNVLRELVRRGAVYLDRRPEPVPVVATVGGAVERVEPFRPDAVRAVGRGGPFIWRVPSGAQAHAVAAVVLAALEEGEQALVLAPEVEAVERLALGLRRSLPAGYRVAAYHSGLGRDRAAIHGAARAAEADVIVGTRAAALLPLARPGAFCIVDEPNESHRAEAGYEGVPVHARDIAIARGRAEGAAVVCLSPVPSLRLSAAGLRGRVGELPARAPSRWPSVRIVDMRGSGAALSSTFLDACRGFMGEGRRTGVVVDRLGYASAVACNRCGAVRRCPDCDLPLALHASLRAMVCSSCGRREPHEIRCAECGSDRQSPTGLAVERVREELSDAIDAPVGLMTAGRREIEDAAVVVGTARCILHERWHAVLIPDVDSSLQGSGLTAAERSFRLVYEAAESTDGVLLVQTRAPEHHVLRAAVRGDYEALVSSEVPRLRAAGYPPFAHLAVVALTGPEEMVFRAVESRLRPALEPGVEMSDPVPVARAGGPPAWRVLLRSPWRGAVAGAAAQAARMAAGTHGLKARVEVDPEEV